MPFLRSLKSLFSAPAPSPPSPDNSEILKLRAELAALREIVLAGSQVDLVDFGELRVMMYTDDAAYKQLDPTYRNHRTGQPPRDLTKPFKSPADRYANHWNPLLSTILSHYWVHDLEFSFFDIGCQYGTSAMAVAQIVLSSGQNNHVYAFDPGIAGQLAPYNIAMNGLETHVTYERLGVSRNEFPGIVYTELGHSENNRIVNRIQADEFRSYPIQCTSIDRYREANAITNHTILKIDTQGGEVEVFAGMTETLRQGHVTCITEYVPASIATRCDPAAWLKQISEGFTIFEIRDNDMFLKPARRVYRIPQDQITQLIQQVTHTDLLLVPTSIPGYEGLAARLEADKPIS